jgi:hypothetical protein
MARNRETIFVPGHRKSKLPHFLTQGYTHPRDIFSVYGT